MLITGAHFFSPDEAGPANTEHFTRELPDNVNRFHFHAKDTGLERLPAFRQPGRELLYNSGFLPEESTGFPCC